MKKKEMVDYMGGKIPAHFLEKPSSGKKKATTIIRRSQPTIQEQIASMVRYHYERTEDLDENFADGDDYADEESRSPHELVLDQETGLEMTRYEKQMLDERRPGFEAHAKKVAMEALRQNRKKNSKKRRPDPQQSEDPDAHEGEDDAND